MILSNGYIYQVLQNCFNIQQTKHTEKPSESSAKTETTHSQKPEHVGKGPPPVVKPYLYPVLRLSDLKGCILLRNKFLLLPTSR